MRVLLVVALLLLVGCSGFQRPNPVSATTTEEWPFRPLEEPPRFNASSHASGTVLSSKMYVADVNAYAYYVYLYAKSINNYAVAKGWRVPMTAPLCEEFILPEFHVIPDRITLDPGSRSAKDISRDLSRQITTLIRNYREDHASFDRAYEAHKRSCLI
ncbi:hypothetical protein pEaSNUABM29_00229 [Erwinia phage pEa_SNUABM_29]|nr:hypothetical protein pEaSNUABM29_00229 [Erwinia phage pEa_SNUABM_29]